PYLRPLLRGDESLAVDYGCGPGRLTGYLASAICGGQAVGLDPTEPLLALAPPGAGVRYEPPRNGRCSLADGAADVVLVCLVLGGLRDRGLDDALREIQRLLRPGGLLFAVESTSDFPSPAHWPYRTVGEYQPR